MGSYHTGDFFKKVPFIEVYMNSGMLKIEWAAQYMPVLAAIRKQFEKERPFAGLTIGMALHVEAKTANLVSTLVAGGAEVHNAGAIRSQPG
jgi:adenosylhomocysteinase